MGRATAGVTGMKFKYDDDAVLSMAVIRAADAAREDSTENVQYVFSITDTGWAKRTPIKEYRVQGRTGTGIKAMQLVDEKKGRLVGAFIVVDGDEILSITASGQVVRSPIDANFTPKGRITQGVRFVSLRGSDTVAVVARSVEARDADEEVTESPDEAPDATIGGTDNGTDAVAAGTDAGAGADEAAEAPEPGESES